MDADRERLLSNDDKGELVMNGLKKLKRKVNL